VSARVVAVAGRRVDAPDSLVRRFPADRIEAVRARLGDRLSTLARGGARTLVASAACGTDLLALEEADRLGFRLRVVLPFEPAQFRSVSVVDRPGDWGSRFDRLVEQVGRRRDLVVLGSRPDDDGAFLATSDAILQEALALARDPAGPPRPDLVSVLVVWDEASRGPDDVTAAFRARAVELRCQVEDLRT
jgi:hypothetical protein